MNATKYIWQNGKMVKWEDATTHVLAHGLHYGTSIFEGIRFYDTGEFPAVFRLSEHIDRFFYSASVLNMKIPYSKGQIMEAIIQTCKINGIKNGYIRPIAFYGYGGMKINPEGIDVEVAIAVWPWASYLGKETVKIKISKYMRIHPKSMIPDAKISGHYVNSVIADIEIDKSGYDEALLLDYEGNIAEGSGENIFYVRDNKVFTVKSGAILDGITRKSVMRICKKELGIIVEEKAVSIDEILSSDEVFFSGTAVEIQPVSSINDHVIGDGKTGNVTGKIKRIYDDIVKGKRARYQSWLTKVE